MADTEVVSGGVVDGKTCNRSELRLVRGDITALNVESFVFYARTDLALGSGFGSAITRRGGAAIKKELDRIGSIGPTQAVVTTAGELKSRYIIHAAGPAFQEEDLERKLSATISNALACAEEQGIRQIAFPPMGAGFYGVPLAVCARVMLQTIGRYLEEHTSLREVIICAGDMREFRPFEAGLAALGRP